MKRVIKPLSVLIIWAAIRWAFFAGFVGYDDIRYYAYAMKWGELPQNHWEARVFFTGLIRLAVGLLGPGELAATLPSLFSSLVMLGISLRLGWRFAGERGALIAAGLFALLPQDVFSSTSVDVVSLTSALTALALLAWLEWPGRKGLFVASLCLGLALFSHAYALFVVAAFAAGLFFSTWPRLRWKESVSLFTLSLAIFLCVNSLVFWWMTGDPGYAFKVSAGSHLQTLEHIVYDWAWVIWPIRAFVFTKEFGVLFLVAAVWLIATWKKASRELRFLGFFCLIFYAYTHWGSQSPTRYLPLWHLPRYVYPLAIPVCVLVACAITSLTRTKARLACLMLGASQLLLLSLAGTWGENVEVSKALLRHATQNPEQIFAADGLTLNEMFVLNGCHPPHNVFPLRGLGQPGFYEVPEATQIDTAARPLYLLVNQAQGHRRGMDAYARFAAQGQSMDLGKPGYRPLAELFPERLRNRPLFLRHSPPVLSTLH